MCNQIYLFFYSRNSRNHTVQDLATSKEILKLISDFNKAKTCKNCNTEFLDNEKK